MKNKKKNVLSSRKITKSESEDARLRQFETDVVLKDGSLVHMRPVRSEDRSLLLEFIWYLFFIIAITPVLHHSSTPILLYGLYNRRKLNIVKVFISLVQLNELLMRSPFDNPALFKHNNRICMLYRR